MNEWEDHAEWWLGEVADDPIYRLDVLPLAKQLLGDAPGMLLDLGCGEGQMMRMVGRSVVGCDISMPLLKRAAKAGPVVRCELPHLDWLQTATMDSAVAVLVTEHLSELSLFRSVARVVKPGGSLVVVANHPAFTAAEAGPIMDPSDGEILWRWGDYFAPAAVGMRAGEGDVTFYHRPLAKILNEAADAGWMLESFVEAGFSQAAIATEPGYVGQEQMPRLLGVRWMNTQGG